MKCFVFYHKIDLDGQGSAAVVGFAMKQKGIEVVFVPVNHGETIDWLQGTISNKIYGSSEDMAVVVDFAPEGDVNYILNDMCKHYARVIWIDHHVTAIQAVKDPVTYMPGIREIGKGAIYLTWKYFFPTENVPEAIKLISEGDVFDKTDIDRFENMVLPFKAALLAKGVSDPRNPFWTQLFRYALWSPGKELFQLIEGGKMVQQAMNTVNEANAKLCAFTAKFEGKRCLVYNGGGGSLAVKSVVRPDHEMIVMFKLTHNKWTYGLYRTESETCEVDCEEIAKKLGGGGHVGAASFTRQLLDEEGNLFNPMSVFTTIY